MKLKLVTEIAEDKLTAILGPKDDPYYADRLLGHSWGCLFRIRELGYDREQWWSKTKRELF